MSKFLYPVTCTCADQGCAINTPSVGLGGTGNRQWGQEQVQVTLGDLLSAQLLGPGQCMFP